MEARLPVWVRLPTRTLRRFQFLTLRGVEVDLGGSLAVASRGLFATGVSTDLNGEDTVPYVRCGIADCRKK